MKTLKFLLVLRTHENTDVFISLDDNIYDIHSKRINVLCLFNMAMGNMNHVRQRYQDIMKE